MTPIYPGLDGTREPTGASIASSGLSARDFAMLAHDVRAALNGVMGGIGLIDVDALEQGQREQFARVSAAAEKMSWLVAAMLDDGSGQGGGVNIAGLVDYIQRRWSGEARQKGMNLRVSVEADVPPWLTADRVDVARMLGNLIGNAIGHVAKGEIRLSVENTRGGGLLFRVRDEGPGIDPAMVEQLIAQGRSRPDAATIRHGLGLTIVRELATKNGAEMNFGTLPEGGFEVTVAFPAQLCSTQERGPRADTAPRGAPVDLAGVRILLAEDNPTNQMVATQMLTKLRAVVTVSSDGVEALEKFETGIFDLVVVDIEMPRLSGLDVIRSIRARRDGRSSVPIVALTAYAMREHQERITEAGANGLISKPISSIEALGRALAIHVAPIRDAVLATGEAGSNDPAGPGVNVAIFETLRQTIGEHMMAELMDKVIADLSSAQADLSGAREPVNRPSIRSASHILISVAGAIGATRLQMNARDLNMAAHSGTSEEILSQLGKCLGEIDVAVAFARSERSRS